MKTTTALFVSITVSVGSAFTLYGRTTALISTTRTASRVTAGAPLHMATVDPTTITKKELDDITGASYDDKYPASDVYMVPSAITEKQHKVLEDIAPCVGAAIENFLLDVGEKSWQPQDYLPDLSQEGWEEQVKELREMSANIPDDLLVVLIGDMVTEEALPSYQTLLNTLEGCDDPSGMSDTPWARWSRQWTAEENRHGDLLNKYLYLGGRCNMRSIEVTIQHLLSSGFNPEAQQDAYRGFVYTSFQERATKVSHGNVGKLVRQHGDTKLSKICLLIAGDEGRHEKAYQMFCEEVIKRDPDGLIKAFHDMMRLQVKMPAEEMTDGVNQNLYEDFAEVAQRVGVYTANDYTDIIEHLVKRWDLEHIEGLSAEAEKHRDYLCRLPDRYRKLAERSMNKKKKVTEDVYVPKPFEWLYGRAV